MLIRLQFHLAYAIVVAAILCALVAQLFMHQRLQKMEDLRAWSREVVKYVLDCNLFGSESILQENARSREQYAAASAKLDGLLGQPPKSDGAQQFIPLIAITKKRIDSLLQDSALKPGAKPTREDYELQAMLASQWMLQTRNLFNSADSLRAFAIAESFRIRRASLWTGAASILFVGVLTGFIFLKSYRNLVSPLNALSEGARRIGAGDLTARLQIHKQDELGQLAANFNAMTAKLQERQAEIDEKIRDLEAFSYSVAHDLKAPLRSVVGFGGLLESDYGHLLDDEGRKYISTMRAASLRMGSLIDDLLEFGQLTHRRIEIQPVPLQPVCDQILAELQPEITSRQATVQFNGDKPTLLANEVLLKQILRNLIANGLKFVPTERTPNVQITTKSNGSTATIEVRDNGIGIPPEHHKKIFGLFHRLHTQKEFPGTGVGLAIVQKGIERLHGRIGLTSKENEGSAFWFELPKAK